MSLLIVCAHASAGGAAPLAPSPDPVTTFISVADSVARSGDEVLATFVKDNSVLVGAAVAKLIDVAFQAGNGGDAAAEKEHVDFARRIAHIHERAGGTPVAHSLVESYTGLSAAQRKQRAQAIALEEEAAAARKAGEVPRAIELLGKARALYEKIGDRHSIAVNWGTTGLTQWATSEWDIVIAHYEQALTARRAVEDNILVGRTLNGLGTAWQQKAQWDKAEEYYQQAIELRTSTGDLTGLGTSITYLGHVYQATGRYVRARDQYQRALPILESLGNPRQMVELLTGIGAANLAMNRTEESNDAYVRAIELAQANAAPDHELIARRNLADNYRREGRFTEALDQLEAASTLLEANPNPHETMLLHETRGLTYLAMGDLDGAREDLVRVTELAQAEDNPGAAVIAQVNIGYLYRDLGAFDRGLKAAGQAVQLAEQAGDGRAYRFALALRGDLEQRVGRFDDAVVSWTEALAQDENDRALGYALVDEMGIATALASKGRGGEAREKLRGLIIRARGGAMAQEEWAALFSMGHTFERENVDSAAFWYERALARLEAMSKQVGAQEVKTDYLSGQKRFLYEEVARFYAQTAQKSGDAAWSDRAFRTMERAKARGLLDMIRASVAGRASDRERGVLDRLYSLDTAAADYNEQRGRLEKEYADLRHARVTRVTAGLSTATAIIGPEEAMRALPKKTALLEYALGDTTSLLWVVDRNGTVFVPLPRRADIEAEVRRLRDAIARPDAGDAALRTSARALYRMLIEPVAGRLEKIETLVIVPDGVLFELPFDALLSADAPEGTHWSAQPFLARTYATVYVPSATIYASLKGGKRRDDYDRDLLAVGNPDYTTLAAATPLEPLPYAEAEVAAIGARVKESRRRVLVGSGATEASLKQELRTASPRVVHFATHGLVDASDPSRSSVALAASSGEDGYLHTLEILATPVRSELVVMSACESARGKISRGEGVVGLSRAFIASGAESVVASLWSVSDASTAELMQVFYERMMGKKHSASRALREARLALIDGGKFAHPFHWSPFVVTGTERSPW